MTQVTAVTDSGRRAPTEPVDRFIWENLDDTKLVEECQHPQEPVA
jgi:hypothetical protein